MRYCASKSRTNTDTDVHTARSTGYHAKVGGITTPSDYFGRYSIPTDEGANTWLRIAAAGWCWMETNAATRVPGPPGAPLARTQAVSGGSRTSQLAERDRDEADRSSEAEGAARQHFSSADQPAAERPDRPDRAAPNPLNATTILKVHEF